MRYIRPSIPEVRSAITIAVVIVFFSAVAAAQTGDKKGASLEAGPIRSSAAYAEILLRKTEIQADIEAYTANYTEANPKMIDLRLELASLDSSLEKVFGVKPSETGKLTQALGKLIVRKAEIDTDLARLSRSYNKDHPEVKRTKRKAEIYQAAIAEILR